MIGQNVRRWVVSISSEHDDPLILGPYTQRKARELSAAFNEQIELGVFEGEGWLHSTAHSIRNPQSVTRMLLEYGKKSKRVPTHA